MPMPSRRLVIVFLVLVALVWLVVNPDGLRHTKKLEADLKAISADNLRIRKENDALRRELQLLSDNPAALERAAREELGLIMPGEVIFRLEEADARSSP